MLKWQVPMSHMRGTWCAGTGPVQSRDILRSANKAPRGVCGPLEVEVSSPCPLRMSERGGGAKGLRPKEFAGGQPGPLGRGAHGAGGGSQAHGAGGEAGGPTGQGPGGAEGTEGHIPSL